MGHRVLEFDTPFAHSEILLGMKQETKGQIDVQTGVQQGIIYS
jgi:hypothetical protein